ncbi:hypothetical protein AKJ16_DCAP10113 [Drosera capensis]
MQIFMKVVASALILLCLISSSASIATSDQNERWQTSTVKVVSRKQVQKERESGCAYSSLRSEDESSRQSRRSLRPGPVTGPPSPQSNHGSNPNVPAIG